MSNPLLLHNNNNNRQTFFFSPVTSFAFPAKHHPFLCFSSIRVTPSLYGSIFLLTTDRAGHRFTHRTRLDKISPLFINEEEGRRGRHGLCVLARSAQNMCSGHGRTASHGRPAKHGRRTASYGKPASYGQRMMKKKMKEEEAEKGQAPAKLSSSKPSRDCIALLFERQPHRLHNNVAMFEHTAGELSNSNQPSPQEPSASTQKVPRLDWERSLSFANGDSQLSSSNGNVKPRPDFSTKLLDILTSFKKKDGLTNYANLTGDMELQPADKSMREDAMQMSPPSKVFISPGFQSRLVQAMETQPKVVDETLNVGSQDDMQGKDVLHKDTQHDLPREDIQHDWLSEDSQHVLSREDNQHDRPSEDTQSDLPRKDSQHDRPSDDIQHDLLRAYVQHDRPCEDTQHDMPSEYTLAIEESDFSSESSDEDGYGDEIEHSQSKFEVLNERERYVSLEGKARLISASTPHVLTGKGRGYVAPRHLSRSTGSRSSPSRSSIPGRRSKYSKPDPKAKQGSTSVSKSSKTESPSQPLPKFKMNIELHGTSELKGEDDEDSVTVMSFQKSQAQAAFQLEESIFFDWSDSDAEDGLPASTAGHPVPVSMEEWSSCSDDEDVSFPLSWMSQGPDALAAEESISFDEYNSDAKADVKNGLSSATALHPPVFSSMEEWSTCSDEDIVTSSLIPFSDQGPNADARSYCNGEESQQPVLDTKCKHISSVGADQNVPHDRVHQNTASVKLVESPLWKNHPLSDLPFEIQYSYSETPNAPILGYREHYSPFGPATMRRPWTGGPPLRPRRHQQAIESFNSALERKKGFNYALYPKGQAGKRTKTREEILGTPLNQEEIVDLVQTCQQENRQVNLGRDGLTHNMLNLIHTHWKRQPLCKIKCMGVPTVDMDNVCFHVEHKTGGQIIYETGGVLYVFRGRNYNYEHRPRIPLMLWKPASPVYPKLVPQAPAGLTNEEAYQLRILGQKVEPLCKLRKNGVFLNLVKDVRDAFRVDDLVSLDYEGLKSGDYKKIGAKLRDLVPCVLLSFRNQRIVLWKGRDLESSSVVDTKEPAGVVRLTANSMQCTNVRASETDLKVLRNEMLLSDLGIVYPHATDDNISPASNKESKQVHHSGGDLDSLYEYSNMIDSSDLISHAVSEQPVESECLAQKWELAVGEEAGEDSEEARITLGEPFKIASLEEQCLDQYSDEIVALSDVPVLSEYFPLCWDEHREFCVRSAGEEGGQNSHLSDTKVGYTPFPVYGVAGEGLDEQEYPSIPPPSTEWAQWNGRHRPKSLFGNVDALWEVALKYGMAVELDDADLEADLVLQKATVFSEIAPAQPEYTEKLVNRLRLKKEYEKAEKCLEVRFGCGGENQTKQNKSAKRAPRFPALEMPPRSGLQVDDLAKILAPK